MGQLPVRVSLGHRDLVLVSWAPGWGGAQSTRDTRGLGRAAPSPALAHSTCLHPAVTAGTAGVRGGRREGVPVSLTGLLFQDMENKIRSTLNEIYFGKTKDIVNGLR